jgi:hypothetical protein
MANSTIVKDYLKNGKKLTPLNGKIPMLKDWTSKIVDDGKILGHKGNLGWVLGEEDLVIDVDPRNDGNMSFIKLTTTLRSPIYKTVTTPGGGYHCYLKIPGEFVDKTKAYRKTINMYPGIDFLTKGSQCVIAGSSIEDRHYEWEDDILDCFHQHSAPEGLLRLLETTKNKQKLEYKEEIEDEFQKLLNSPNSPWTRDKVLEEISNLDPNMSNDEWVKVGMALHEWDKNKGLKIWEDWSKPGDTYKKGECKKRWQSFSDGGGVTLGTISHMSKVVTYDEKQDEVSRMMSKIVVSDEKALEFDILPAIRKMDLSDINTERLAQGIKERYKTLGLKLPIARVREMVTDIVTGSFIEDGEKPDWCEDWVMVNSHGQFFNLKKADFYSSAVFNNIVGKYVPSGPSGSKPSATKYVADSGFIETVDSSAYLPNMNERICNIEGKSVVNTFDPKSVPPMADEISQKGKEAIFAIKRHIRMLCSGDEADAEILTQWIAHQIQYPGKKIRWAVVIYSVQGLGKTFLGEMIRVCLGNRNVVNVKPSEVVSKFNAWATGSAVAVLEEVRIQGKNRYEATNALKPLITDRVIQIRDLNTTAYETYNTTNYMLMSNFKDCIPLTDEDRRWWVIWPNIDGVSGLENHMGMNHTEYFDMLYGTLTDHGSEVRKWLMDYEITEEFKSIKRAPMTDAKILMIANEEDKIEGLVEAREMISKGGENYDITLVCAADLLTDLIFEYPDMELTPKSLGLILRRLGYSKLPYNIRRPVKDKLRTSRKRFWSQRMMTPEEIHMHLDGGSVLSSDYLDDI